MSERLSILPKVGFGTIKLGASRDAVEKLLRLPDEIELQAELEVWRYDETLELTFSAEVDYQLSCITVSNQNASLDGKAVIGLSEEALVEAFPFLTLDSDPEAPVAENNGKDYICLERELSVWLVDDKVINVSLFPAFDDSGEQPLWPD